VSKKTIEFTIKPAVVPPTGHKDYISGSGYIRTGGVNVNAQEMRRGERQCQNITGEVSSGEFCK